MSSTTDRRAFLRLSGALAGGWIGRALLAPRPAYAGEHAAALSYEVPATREGICATCQYWGGARRASIDRKTVNCYSLGWCNNPSSPNYQRTTTPESGPMKQWRKWSVLEGESS